MFADPEQAGSGLSTLARTGAARSPRDMLVYDFIHVPLPVAQVRQRLQLTVSGLWQKAAVAAYDHGLTAISGDKPSG